MQLQKAIERVRAGDTLVIVRIDRLARSLSHLLEVVEGLRNRGAHFRSLTDPIDTSNPQGMLMTQLLGAVAEFERTLIQERTKAGAQAAIARGRRPGNPKMRARDATAIAILKATARDRYLRDLENTRGKWLPIVERLRPMLPWKVVVRKLNSLPAMPRTFSERSLVKACRAMVTNGLTSPDILNRTPARPGEDRIARLVASRLVQEPDLSLRALARWLTNDLREPTPRGGYQWSAEGVRREVEKAKKLKIIS